MDPIRIQADRYFNKTFLDSKLKNSELYETFFSEQNYNYITSRIEKNYHVKLSDSYRKDIFYVMLNCWEYHPINLLQLNHIVFIQLMPKLKHLIDDQNRYNTNIYEIAENTFIRSFELPQLICSRTESLSFTEALFGRNDKNAQDFNNFKTG